MLKHRFKQARENAGYTQETAAQAAKVSQTAIFKIEKGETQRPRKIALFAELFDCMPEWLMYGTSSPKWLITTDNAVQEESGSYALSQEDRLTEALSLNDKKLMYCALLSAHEHLEAGKALTGDEYSFKTLAKVAVLNLSDLINEGSDPDTLIQGLEETLNDKAKAG